MKGGGGREGRIYETVEVNGVGLVVREGERNMQRRSSFGVKEECY